MEEVGGCDDDGWRRRRSVQTWLLHQQQGDVYTRPNLSAQACCTVQSRRSASLSTYLAISINILTYTYHGDAFTLRRHNARHSHITIQVPHGFNTQRPRHVG